MRSSRYPQLSRILVLLALFQIVAPSVAALADAWRMDRREAYAHVESESSPSCAVVHDHACVLCSIATAPSGVVPPPPAASPSRQMVESRPVESPLAFRWTLSHAGTPRAPPVLQG